MLWIYSNMDNKSEKIGDRAIPYLDQNSRRERREELKELMAEPDSNLDRTYTDKSFVSLLGKYFDPKKKTLDAGSGKGTLLQMLQERGFTDTYAADIDDYLATVRPTKEFRVVDFNFDKFPWADGFFDQIASVEVVEHLENPYHFLREAARLLKKGGMLLVTTPNPDHFWNKLSFLRKGEFYRFLPGNDHLTLFADPIIRKGALTYFKLVETKYSWGTFPYRWFNRSPMPASKYFGHSVMHVFKKK